MYLQFFFNCYKQMYMEYYLIVLHFQSSLTVPKNVDRI